jgi:hypothetical protein
MTDLNDHLFAELERLSDEELVGEKLVEEITRAKAVSDVASQIIATGTLVLNAAKAVDGAIDKMKLPLLLPE